MVNIITKLKKKKTASASGIIISSRHVIVKQRHIINTVHTQNHNEAAHLGENKTYASALRTNVILNPSFRELFKII